MLLSHVHDLFCTNYSAVFLLSVLKLAHRYIAESTLQVYYVNQCQFSICYA